MSSISTGRRFAEPFNRLKNRANLFRRKNYSSQLNISSRSSSSADQVIPTDQPSVTGRKRHADVILLKRSNSMVCPQQHLQTLLNGNQTSPHRNSVCLELAGCSIDESSTDDFQSSRSSLNYQSTWLADSTMNNIDENDSIPTTAILTEMNELEEEQLNNDGK